MKTQKHLLVLRVLLIFLVSFIISTVYSQEYTKLPSKIQIAFMMRIFEFNKTILNANKDISIHFINDDYMYEEFSKLIGIKIKGKVIKKVTQSTDDSLPSYIPSIIYVGNSQNMDSIKEFTQKNKILSVTGNPELIKNGLTVSIVVHSGTPNVIFNSISSEKESMEWDNKMSEISTIIK